MTSAKVTRRILHNIVFGIAFAGWVGGCGGSDTAKPGDECPAGFVVDSEVGCADVDECIAQPGICGSNLPCVNVPGSFACTCPPGFSWDNGGCADNDECTTNTHDCDANASCINTDGSFMCQCNAHYQGDGHTCTLAIDMNLAGPGGASFMKLVAQIDGSKVVLKGFDGGDNPFVPYDSMTAFDCSAQAFTIVGTAGDDTIDLRLCTRAMKVLAGAGSDTIEGGKGADNLDGEDGNDYLDGNEGNDTIFGGGGNDTIYGGTGSQNALYGEDGDDTIFTCGYYDTYDGGAGADLIQVLPPC